jgi:hypothetical protein
MRTFSTKMAQVEGLLDELEDHLSGSLWNTNDDADYVAIMARIH